MKQRIVGGALALLLLGLGAGLAWWVQGPSEADIQRAIVSTVQKETPEAFLVTGVLSMQAEERVTYTESVAPEFYQMLRRSGLAPDVDLVTTEANVRVSGNVTYGFLVTQLEASHIERKPDGTVHITVPPLQVHSVAPDLETLEVQTGTRGWFRLFSSDLEADARAEALSGVQAALRRQAEQRLQERAQAQANTEDALEAMLAPPLKAAGVIQPRFTFTFSEAEDTPVLQMPTD